MLDDEIQEAATTQALIHPDNGRLFSHAIGGGADIASLAEHSGQYLSLESGLVRVLPLWLAIAFDKVLLAVVGFIGTYLICRRMAGADRAVAVGLALFYIVSHERLTVNSFHHGLGFGLVPLAIWLVVGRIGRRHYWWGVVGIAALNAVSSTPTHSNQSLFIAIVLAALLLRGRRAWAVVPAIGVTAGMLLLNWHESLYAKAQIGPFSYRGVDTVIAKGALETLVHGTRKFFTANPELAALILISLALLYVFRDARRHRALVLAAIGLEIGSALQILPWSAVGLGMLNGFQFRYGQWSLFPVGLLIVAMAARHIRWSAAPLMAVAAGMTASLLAYEVMVWIGEGGQSILAAEERVFASRPWEPAEPVRTISVPYRTVLNAPAAMGMRQFDGALALNLLSISQFWQYGVFSHSPVKIGMGAGLIRLNMADAVMKTSKSLRLADFADLNFLRIANVGLVVSVLPLTDSELRLVNDPVGEDLPPQTAGGGMARFMALARAIRHPAPVRVYALDHPLPMVFAASQVVTVGNDVDDRAFYREIGRLALLRAAVRRDDGRVLAPAQSSLKVIDYRLIPDGFDIDVDAPDGGVVVINTPWLPYWHAVADGQAVAPPVAVNGMHMALSVPRNAHQVRLRFERPLLRERLWSGP